MSEQFTSFPINIVKYQDLPPILNTNVSGSLLMATYRYGAFYLEGITLKQFFDWINSQENIITDLVTTDKSITPASGKTYNCGTLTSLTITYPSGYFAAEVNFSSGSTPTTLTVPAGTLWHGGEAPEIEANTSYRLTFQFDGVAVKANCGGYAVPA
jgi:hypothetical protein